MSMRGGCATKVRVTHLVGSIGPVDCNNIIVFSRLTVCDELLAGAGRELLSMDLANHTDDRINVWISPLD